jgi:Ni/Co efflux regulator RcnB
MADIIKLWIQHQNRKGSVFMKIAGKRIIIFSMIGLMQVGMFSSVVAASPLHNDQPPIQQRYDRHDREQDRHHMEQERHDRERVENERHDYEMQRRHGESRKHWRERQKIENERHQHELERIHHEFEHQFEHRGR